MKYRLVIDKDADEEVVVTARQRSPLTDQLELLVLEHSGSDRIPGYRDDDIQMLKFSDIACITVLNGKTYAIDSLGRHFRLKQRLYELEKQMPPSFIRINKSAIGNEAHLERFTAAFSGAVDAVFTGGHREYVSRRCFAAIKRRYEA